jgi:hypothetical protein
MFLLMFRRGRIGIFPDRIRRMKKFMVVMESVFAPVHTTLM